MKHATKNYSVGAILTTKQSKAWRSPERIKRENLKYRILTTIAVCVTIVAGATIIISILDGVS